MTSICDKCRNRIISKYLQSDRPIKLHHFYTTSAYAQARENHRCSYTQIMDVYEDSDLSFLNTFPLVKNVWVYIGAFYVCVNKYQLKKMTHQVIIQSTTVNLQTCARHVCFYCFQRAPGIGLKDRMHRSRYKNESRREKI